MLVRGVTSLMLAVLLSGCALTLSQSYPEVTVRVTSYLSGFDDQALRQGLAENNVLANRDANQQLTFRKVEDQVFGNRLTLIVHWSHRPAGQFALRNDKTVLSAPLPQQNTVGNHANDQALLALRKELLNQIARQIGEEIQTHGAN